MPGVTKTCQFRAAASVVSCSGVVFIECSLFSSV